MAPHVEPGEEGAVAKVKSSSRRESIRRWGDAGDGSGVRGRGGPDWNPQSP